MLGPNPCKLVPAATVASTLKLKGPAPNGTLTTRTDGPVKQDVCTFAIAGKQLQIDVAPHHGLGGSAGGVPGIKSAKPSGLGAGATMFYDTNPSFMFATVTFTRGTIDAVVYDNGKVESGDVLALARIVYKALPAS